MKSVHLLFLGIIVAVLMVPVAPLAAQEPSPEAQATSHEDPTVDVAKLNLLLKPLTQEELVVEAEAWMELLKEKVGELSASEIAAKTAEGDEFARLDARSVELRTELNALSTRVNTVVKALMDKGGETEHYEKYIAAVTRLPGASDLRALWNTVYSWLISADGGIKYGINILLFLVTIIVFWILAAVLGRVVQKGVSKLKNTSELLREFFVTTTRKLTFFIGFVIALSMLGVEIGPFLAALGVAGFVVGFALQGTLSNFASGIMILIYRPYDIGDVISVAGVAGKVEAMTLVSTSILTFDNQKVVVPNNSIWGDVITNITGSETRRVDMVFGIGYSDDIPKAQAILEEIVKNHPLALGEPEPVVRLHELADSSVNFVVRPWCKTSDYWNVYWDVTKSVKERFDAQSVSIPFPQQDVHFYQESPETSPSSGA